jgi:gliding motility-associated-like protein
MMDTCKQLVNIREFPTIPQLISPNGDGINDKFVIDGLKGFPNSQLLIFTRSGQLVYKSDDYQNDWDGRYQASTWSRNNIVAPGVYYYILTLGEVKQKMQGYVYVYY